MTDNIIYPSKSGQVSRHGWRVFRKWYWQIHDYGDYSADEGYCFTRKNAIKKAGMDR